MTTGPATGVIEVRGLRVAGICGVLPEEQARTQPLVVDLDLTCDLTEAGRTDDLTATVDYASVIEQVHDLVATGRVQLLERLAHDIAGVCLADPRVTEVTVAVRKLRPPVPQLVDTTGVRLTRRR